ncbi:hypothetical protein Hanom_Chr14g01260811 [Helianthus anomalus]
MTKSEHPAIPSKAEEATSLGLQVTLGDISSEAATTIIETTVLQLVSGYIHKTSLKATTVEATKVTFVPVGSPQYQDKGASGFDVLGFISKEKPDTTTIGGSSGDPIKFGDELRYQDLAERVSKIETSVDETKNMMKQMFRNLQKPILYTNHY